MLLQILMAKSNIAAGIVIGIFIVAMAYKLYRQDKKDSEDYFDRWNDPSNWRKD